MDVVQLLLSNAGAIVAAIGAIIVGLGALAELTPWEWDNKVIKVIREIWKFIPIGNKDVSKMGTGRPDG